jgi:hypothetical protein
MPQKIIQITDDTGAPIAGHVFEAPDEASLDAAMADLPAGCWHEVATLDDLVIPPPPAFPDLPPLV